MTVDGPKLKEIVISGLGTAVSSVDDTFIDYVCSVLSEEAISGHDAGEIIETLSPFLIDASVVQGDDEASAMCNTIVGGMSEAGMIKVKAKTLKTLDTTVNMSKITITDKMAGVSDWMKPDERISNVNRDALAKNEDRYQQRKELRAQRDERKKERKNAAVQALNALKEQQNALANSFKQPTVIGRDVKVEKFALAYGKMELITCSDVTIVYGRKYGLIGRNGTGKTTLLKAIVHRELAVPSNISILHVEQEVEGTETTVLQAVLEADVVREKLLAEERRLIALGDEDKQHTTAQLVKVYAELEAIDAHSAEARASAILVGLGFTAENQEQPTKEFSGGWRMRISLARALFIQPDLLLLDEPTNHLDLFACLWLENYLQSWNKTLIIVSHQRDFLNAVCTDIIHFHSKKLEFYRGNYDAFEKVRYERLKQQQKAHDAQQMQRKHIQKFIDKFRYNAKRAKMAQSRIKKLERMDLVPEIMNDPTVVMEFLEPEILPPPVLQFQDASFGYTKEKNLFRRINLGIDMDSRVALVGANGVGKTTLLKLLCGELEPTEGHAMRHGKLKFARFSQHFVDQLDLTQSPLEFFMTKYTGVNQQIARSHLGKFGLSGDLALRTINTLSGGQKSRVVFAIISWPKPQVLLLDEPSNHLDIETVDALTQALNNFGGGVLLVSHDERLISHVCDEIWYFDETEEGDREVKIFDGDFDDYKRQVWNLTI